MATEIERKYLVNKKLYSQLLVSLPAVKITQGYLTLQPLYHTRIRMVEDSEGRKSAFIASKLGSGVVRQEFEEELSVEHAEVLLANCLRVVIKERRKVMYEGAAWEVDFYPQNGLVVAEIELASLDEKYSLPTWVEKEVSGVKKYSNIALAKKPKQKKVK